MSINFITAECMFSAKVRSVLVRFFCQAYTFGLCEISNLNFMWLIEGNYPPKAPTKNNGPP